MSKTTKPAAKPTKVQKKAVELKSIPTLTAQPQPNIVPIVKSNNLGRFINYSLVAFLGIVAYLYVQHLRVGFFNTILEQHPFRQTQTGLTTLYFIKEGIKLNYITPMYGYPWTIPMEFPLYQMVTALYAQISPTNLDVSGRTVSIVFFILSLIPLYFIIRRITDNPYAPLVSLSFVLLNPIVIYWSRTFMIESTAVCFGLYYVWVGLENLHKPNYGLLIPGLLLGAIAPITKSTTGFIFVVVLGLFYLVEFVKDYKHTALIDLIKKYWLNALVFFAVPALSILVWTLRTDTIKLSHYATSFWASSNEYMKNWNYGTFDQKTSWATWQHINDHQFNGLFFSIVLTLFAVFTKKGYRTAAIILTVGGLAGPAMFTNLYYIHDYYSYPSTYLFCASAGILASYFIVNLNNVAIKSLAFVIVAFFAVFLYRLYENSYLANFQRNYNDYFKVVGENLNKQIKEDEGFIFFGYDGDPFVPYYGSRKGVCMSAHYLRDAKENPDAFYKKIEESNIKALVVCDGVHQDQNLINKAIEHFKLDPTPVNTDVQTMGYYIFVAKR